MGVLDYVEKKLFDELVDPDTVFWSYGGELIYIYSEECKWYREVFGRKWCTAGKVLFWQSKLVQVDSITNHRRVAPPKGDGSRERWLCTAVYSRSVDDWAPRWEDEDVPDGAVRVGRAEAIDLIVGNGEVKWERGGYVLCDRGCSFGRRWVSDGSHDLRVALSGFCASLKV